tara:strand:- start:1708 stop:2583 length:876 start_codon:yes stop_codon:yes gene_type:complete
MFRPFYNESIRRLVVAFGSLFNNIQLESTNSSGSKEYIRVPLSYGPKEKFLRRIEEESSISDGTKVQITLPRLGFDITDISYDAARKRNTLEKRLVQLGGTAGTASYSYAEVPYNFSFSLYGFVKNMTDALQMTEQILPYFTPEFNVTINFGDINRKVDIPIILNNVSIEQDYEGDFESRRNITTQYDFTVKSYVYGEAREKSVINYTESTFFNLVGESWRLAGPSGALSRVDVGVCGASSGAGAATMDNYNFYSNVYTQGPSGISLATSSRYIDTFGNTYAGASYNPPLD